jgi:hypothetical protein
MLMLSNSQKRLLVAGSLVLTLGGCASLQSDSVAIHPSLPPAPAGFGEQVAIPAPSTGDDPRVYAGHVIAAAKHANRRLANDKAFYNDLRARLK